MSWTSYDIVWIRLSIGNTQGFFIEWCLGCSIPLLSFFIECFRSLALLLGREAFCICTSVRIVDRI